MNKRKLNENVIYQIGCFCLDNIPLKKTDNDYAWFSHNAVEFTLKLNKYINSFQCHKIKSKLSIDK